MACSQGAPDADDDGDGAPPRDRFVRVLEASIRASVRVLAVLMVLVIFLGVVEVAVTLYQRFVSPPFGLLQITNVFATFGVIMAVLIAIEIFHNIVLYLREDVFPVRAVLSIAMIAIARKIVVLDYHDVSAAHVFATAAVMFAVGIAYFLVVTRAKRPS